MVRSVLLLFFINIFALSVISTKKDNKNKDTFVATNVWKDIKDGQKVPSGLHYRINLQTGQKEAKLLDQSEAETDRNKNTNTMPVLVREEFSSNNKLDADDNSKQLYNYEIPKYNKFKSYDKLKEDLDSLNLNIKTDSEVLKDLFEKYKKEYNKKTYPLKDKKLLTIIQDLANMAHQFDNALDFVKLNGFNNIIYPNLNSTSNNLKLASLKLFSSLVQNNAKVKIHGLETGALQILLRILDSDENTENIKMKTVTALSCLIRTFPFAQNEFVEKGGLSIVSELFNSNFVKLKLKLAILMSDLFLEREIDAQNFDNHKDVDFKRKLFDINFCEKLNKLLEDLLMIDPNDYDSVEKCLITMNVVRDRCGIFFNQQIINKLCQTYDDLSLIDEDNEYYMNLSLICKQLLLIEEVNKVKTELYTIVFLMNM